MSNNFFQTFEVNKTIYSVSGIVDPGGNNTVICPYCQREIAIDGINLSKCLVEILDPETKIIRRKDNEILFFQIAKMVNDRLQRWTKSEIDEKGHCEQCLKLKAISG